MEPRRKQTTEQQRESDPEKYEQSLKSLLLRFMGYTSAHGIGRLAESKTVFRKIFWSAACLAATTMFIFQAIGLFMLYLSRPVSTSITVSFEKKLPFPAVTICNLNMFRKDSLPDKIKEELKTKLNYDEWSNYNSDTTGRQVRSGRFGPPPGSGEEPNTPDAYDPYDDDYYDDDDAYQDYTRYENEEPEDDDIQEEYPDESQISTERRLQMGIAQMIGELEKSTLYHNGHLFEQMILNCSWRDLDCSKGSMTQFWTKSWNYKYGNCYTFNSGFDDNIKPMRFLTASKPGPSQGLTLHIDIQQSQYVGPLAIEAGVRVVLHGQGHMPFPFEEGFSVAPRMATSVGIKRTQILRLDRFQNKSCVNDDHLSVENIYRKFYNITHYSQQACLNSCLGLSQFSKCKCSEAAYPSKGKPCDTLDPFVASCLKTVKGQFNHDRLDCIDRCRQPCRDEVIEKTISSSQWPSTAYEKFLKSRQPNSNESDNFLVLNVFFNELNLEKIKEEYSCGGIKLLADIGGQLGLWIGISVLTCCEVLELFMKFLSHIIKKCQKAAAAQTQVEDFRPYNDR